MTTLTNQSNLINESQLTNRSPHSVDYRQIVMTCLLFLLISFATLVPGGPIENRDFSHLSGFLFWGFNAFLITLSLSGFATVFRLWRGKESGAARSTYWAAIIVSWLYVVVVASDLGQVFPTSPDATGFALGMIMIVDAILAVNVVIFSHKALGHL